jgi:hypothetical protein
MPCDEDDVFRLVLLIGRVAPASAINVYCPRASVIE